MEKQKWLGKLTTKRWTDDTLSKQSCFLWLNHWKECPVDVVADIVELYQQLLSTRVYYQHKIGEDIPTNNCRLWNVGLETVAHVLTGCSRLTQSEYLYRHNNGMKCLYYSLLKHHDLTTKIPPWNSMVFPKPLIENTHVSVHWDIPIYSTGSQMLYNQEQGNRPDAVVYDHAKKEVTVFEFSCPWITNRDRKFIEKQEKYQEVRKELKEQHHGYKFQQINIIVDALGGYSERLQSSLVNYLGKVEAHKVLKMIQRAVLFGSIRTKNLFKATVHATS